MLLKDDIAEEQKKIRYLRTVVDLTAATLCQADLTLVQALELVRATKRHVLFIFPDKEDTYDLIYKPRFERIIRERIINTVDKN